MKENVLDVLMYLFDHFSTSDDIDEADQETLEAHLHAAGFEHHEIRKAFNWMEGLTIMDESPLASHHSPALRQYAPDEDSKLGRNGQGFIMSLEQNGILNPLLREMVIDRVMALDTEEEIDLDQLKWVTMMVISNQTNDEGPETWVENYLLDDEPPVLH